MLRASQKDQILEISSIEESLGKLALQGVDGSVQQLFAHLGHVGGKEFGEFLHRFGARDGLGQVGDVQPPGGVEGGRLSEYVIHSALDLGSQIHVDEIGGGLQCILHQLLQIQSRQLALTQPAQSIENGLGVGSYKIIHTGVFARLGQQLLHPLLERFYFCED